MPFVEVILLRRLYLCRDVASRFLPTSLEGRGPSVSSARLGGVFTGRPEPTRQAAERVMSTRPRTLRMYGLYGPLVVQYAGLSSLSATSANLRWVGDWGREGSFCERSSFGFGRVRTPRLL